MLTEQNIQQMLEAEKFRLWLQRHQDNDSVGYTREDGTCPIAQYLTDTIYNNDEYNTDFGRISVSEQFIEVLRKDSYGSLIKITTPQWASMFISKVDEIPDLYPQYEIYEDDETGEEIKSDTPSDHIPVGKFMAIEILDDAIESATELEYESQEVMLKEYSYNV